MGRIPKQEIFEALSHLQGDVGLFIKDLQTDETFEVNCDQVFSSASVIKIPMLALLLQDVQEKLLDWGAP